MSLPNENENPNSLDDLERLGQSITTVIDDGDEALAPLPPRKAPAFLRFMPDLVRDMWEKGANFTLESTSGELLVEGFYKNGPLRLDLRENGVVAIDKRGRERDIRSFDDLADLNYKFWRQANSQKGVYVHPLRPWVDAMLDKKKLKRQVIYVPADENDDIDLGD